MTHQPASHSSPSQATPVRRTLLLLVALLTGGSARMEGVVELAEEMLHMPVRVGIPQHVTGLGEVINNPVHATGVGLLLWGRSLEAGPRPSLNAGKAGVAFTRFRNWFRGAF